MAELPLEGDTIWYEARGDGPPLVFVHGGWQNGRAWRPQLDRFAEEYRTVALDVRGHGRTGATDPKRYSIDLFTDDLEALLDHLGLEQPILCGLSLGSMVVQTYLSRHPDHAAGAVLGGAVRSMPPVELPAGTKPFLSPLPALTASLSTVGPEATFRSMLWSIRTTTGERWLSVDPEVRAEAMAAVDEVSRTEFRKIFGALYRYEPPTLTHVETPTFVVHGDQEAPPVKVQGQEIAAAVEDGSWLEIADSGHLVNQDRPEAFNDVLETVLDRRAAT